MFAIRKTDAYPGTIKLEDKKITFNAANGHTYIYFFDDIEIATEVYLNDTLAGVLYLIIAGEANKDDSIFNSEEDKMRCVHAMYIYFIDKYSNLKLEQILSDKTFRQLFTLIYSNNVNTNTSKPSAF